MGTCARKTPILNFVKWFKDGDHESVSNYDGDILCESCKEPLEKHGWIGSENGWYRSFSDRVVGFVVCPGDYIVTERSGVVSVIKPSEFIKFFITIEEE